MVQPPDEYHTGVNNSVYTNCVARLSLETAVRAAKAMRRPYDVYEHYADRVYVPFDGTLQYHPEYDGYVQGKQGFNMHSLSCSIWFMPV